MTPSNNKVIVASAGSGKTTNIVKQVLSITGKNKLITTYTNENLDQINSYLIKLNGCVPKDTTVISWFSFLLQDGVRPYQSCMTEKDRINSIIFDQIPESIRRGVGKDNIDVYYLTKGNNIYKDRVSDFVCQCDDRTEGMVIQRLQDIYDYIFIDEIQDFAGYDLEIVEKLCKSKINTIAVGDPRQSTYVTNNSAKNKQYRKHRMLDWIDQKSKDQLFSVEEWTDSYRCNQQICDFADALYPQLPKTNSLNKDVTGHDGIIYVKRREALDYVKTYNPTILRWDKRSDTLKQTAINIGVSKGRTYDRVLIFPTKPMIDYLKNKDISKAGDISKLYVAVTRARFSVTFVVD